MNLCLHVGEKIALEVEEMEGNSLLGELSHMLTGHFIQLLVNTNNQSHGSNSPHLGM